SRDEAAPPSRRRCGPQPSYAHGWSQPISSYALHGLVLGRVEADDLSWRHSSQAVGSVTPLPTADARVAPWLPPAAAIALSTACHKCGRRLPRARSTLP